MNPDSQMPGTPKQDLQAIRIIFFAIIAGALIFAVIVLVLNQLQGPALQNVKKVENILLYVVTGVAAICLPIAMNGYNKGVAVAKNSLISLPIKLNQYRSTLVRYIALCEGPALFSIIAFFMVGNYYLFIITAIMIAAMLAKLPNRQRVLDELALDWKQQQELE